MSNESARTQVVKRLPGKPKPTKELLDAYTEANAQQRQGLDRVVWDILAPDAREMVHWRAELECGCVHDLILSASHEKEGVPTGRFRDPVDRLYMPEGQRFCWEHREEGPKPYRRVVEWGTRMPGNPKVSTHPAQPEEPPYESWADDPELREYWASTRHAEPYDIIQWRATLECGHETWVIVDEDFDPKVGPQPSITEERASELIEEVTDYLQRDGLTDEEIARWEHHVRMAQQRCPRPDPEQACHTCTGAKWITRYQRVGWLDPSNRPPEPVSPEEARQRKLANAERALKAAQRDVKRRAEELARLQQDDE